MSLKFIWACAVFFLVLPINNIYSMHQESGTDSENEENQYFYEPAPTPPHFQRESLRLEYLSNASNNTDYDVYIARKFFYQTISSVSFNTNIDIQDSSLNDLSSEPELLSPYPTINQELESDNQSFTRATSYQRNKKKLILGSGTAVLAGMAMTPVMLTQLSVLTEKMGVNVFEDSAVSEILRYGTMAFLSGVNVVQMSGITLNEAKKYPGKYHLLGKTALASLTTFPLLMLFHTEYEHLQYASNPAPYIAVFSIGAIPLVVNEYMDIKESVFYLAQQNQTLSYRQKLFAYALPLLTTVSRGLAGYAIVSNALESVGFEGDENAVVSVLFGSVVGNSANLLAEINGIRSLMAKATTGNEEDVAGLMNNTRSKMCNVAKNTAFFCVGVIKTIPYAATILNLRFLPSWTQWTLFGNYIVSESFRYSGSLKQNFEYMICGFKS